MLQVDFVGFRDGTIHPEVGRRFGLFVRHSHTRVVELPEVFALEEVRSA